MENISIFWQALIGVLGAIGGLSALIMFFMLFRQNKRIKTNEADRGEIQTFREIIDGLRKEIELKSKDISELKRRVKVLEDADDIKSDEISIYKKVMAITCGRKVCPRDIAYAKLKEEEK